MIPTCYTNYVKETCQRRHGVENRIEELRKNLGMNQAEFAKALGVSRQTVSSIETGKYNPSLELAFAISDFFGQKVEEIFIHERRRENEKK